jgi:hypothetical protein
VCPWGVWAQLSIPLAVLHTPPTATPRWEHEVFAARGLPAATLSARRSPPPPLARSSVLDCGPLAVNATSVSRAVQLVGEALVRHMCGGPFKPRVRAVVYFLPQLT